ncbi:hypothetical protein [Nostoc sp.]|uniref:hypothetical protein n=1 Tax=Nostoc sp. TaxID=1180 RepID=UPI002FF4ACF6
MSKSIEIQPKINYEPCKRSLIELILCLICSVREVLNKSRVSAERLSNPKAYNRLEIPINRAKNLPKQPGLISIKPNLDCPMTAIVIKTIPAIKNVLFGVKSVIFLLRYLSIFIVAIISSNFYPGYMQKHKKFAPQHLSTLPQEGSGYYSIGAGYHDVL